VADREPPKLCWIQARCSPAARCSTGKTDPTARRALLRFWEGMITPERNQSGIVVAWTIGCAASAEPITPDTA
jgi:hypothetical protein